MSVASDRVMKTVAIRRPLGSRIVSVFVGNSTEPIKVHRNVLLRSSEFFQKALNSDLKEKDGVVRLQKQTVTEFEIYVDWLYAGVLGLEDEGVSSPVGDLKATEQRREIHRRIFGLYILGDILRDQHFCNAVIDCHFDYRKSKGHGWLAFLAKDAWAILPEGSPFRRLLIDNWAAQGHVMNFEPRGGGLVSGDVSEGPAEFWLAVSKRVIMLRAGEDTLVKPSWETRCSYHYHKDGETCM